MPSSLRKTLLLLPLTLAALLALAAALFFACLGTEAGTNFLANQAMRLAGDQVQWQRLQGTLLGPLRLEGIKLRQPGLDVEMASLSIDWRPAALLEGRLEIVQLAANDVHVTLSESDPEPPSNAPFQPGELPLPVDVWVAELAVNGLQLVIPEQPEQHIAQIQLAARLEDRRLKLEQFQLRTMAGGARLHGSTVLSNTMPLDLHLAWDWQLPGQDGEPRGLPAANTGPAITGELAITGNLRWSAAIGFELQYQLSAQPLTQFDSGMPERIEALGRLDGQFGGEELELTQLSLALQGLPHRISLQGNAEIPATGAATVDARMQWQDLQWPLEGVPAAMASPSGELAITGSTDSYQLTMTASATGEQVPAGDWLLEGTGNLEEFQLDTLRGLLLGGSVELDGVIVWDPVATWSLAARGQELDPGQWLPDYPGQLAFNLHSAGQVTSQEGPTATLDLRRLAGELAGYPFELTALAKLAGETVDLQSLQLDSAGNRLSAQGLLSEQALKLDWLLAAHRPDALLPGASGQMTGSGQLLGSAQAPRLQGSLSGNGLGIDNYKLDSLQAEFQAGLDPSEQLQLALTMGKVLDGDQELLQAVQLRVAGTNSQHRLSLDLEHASEELRISLEGGLNQALSTWEGALNDLTVTSTDYGNWRLTNSAPISLAASAVQLEKTCLQDAAGPAKICASAAWQSSGSGTLTADIQALPVARLMPSVGGEVGGQLTAEVAADGTLQANTALAMSPGLVRVKLDQGTQELPHDGGDLTLTIDSQGLDAQLQFKAPAQGEIRAELQLPNLTQLPPLEDQPLAGRIQARLPDLSALPAWLPELAASAGRLNADLRLTGTLDQPGVTGKIALANGAADIPSAGLKLRQIQLTAASNPNSIGQMTLTGGLVSGGGRLDLQGELELASNNLVLNITGDEVQVYDTADVRAVASPDLQISWSDQILKLRGQIVIPEAAITPKLGLNPALQVDEPEATSAPGQIIAPSPDVVIIDSDGVAVTPPPAVSPIKLDNQVTLVLGDDVNVNTLGFISRITGEVTFINEPDNDELLPRADGRLSVKDGTFRAFGQDLEIQTGQLIFGNVPVDKPELNVRAVRWIENDPDVTVAGVLVTGPAAEPNVELFSRRQVEDTQIQSYLLTGRAPGDNDSVLGMGTYLHPKFYVGYGYNLIQKTSEFNSLYTITPRYGINANVGEADNNLNLTFTHER